jgi:hypothetical protein
MVKQLPQLQQPPQHTLPFDAIRQIDEHGQEYWSARDLQTLLDYAKWQNFEITVKRAMISCKVAGLEVSDHFTDISKMVQLGSGSRRSIQDYHLTRFACYSIAMNGDVEKPSIAQAQTYFNVQVRRAEIAQQRQTRPSIPTISDVLRQRALLNENRVPVAFFAAQGELARELHYWEDFINGSSLDNKASLENSVGQCFSYYARNILHIPDAERRKYRHRLPNGRVVTAWAYPLRYMPDFRRWICEVYFPEKFDAYQQRRARYLGVTLPQTSGTSRKQIAQRSISQLPLF